MIAISLPLFVFHWLWAQRLANQNMNEREASLRRLYLYGMLGGFLGAVVANVFSLITNLLWMTVGNLDSMSSTPAFSFQNVFYNLLAIVVLGALWTYQKQVVSADEKIAPSSGALALIRRLYLFGFSACGLTMTILAIIHLIRWLLYQIGRSPIIGAAPETMTVEVGRLIVGLALWLIFWSRTQILFRSPNEEERTSALRKFYLYASVFVGVLGAVTNATFMLAGLLRRFLELESVGDYREPLPIIIGCIILWAYHAYILRHEGEQVSEVPRQGEIRRIYLYMVAGVGLAAFLVGLSGDLSVLIRSFTASFTNPLKEQLAWFTATMIAGLPVWLLPWRQAQSLALPNTPSGEEERRSTVRKYYLYFFLLVATLAVLSSAVYILYRLLSLALGEPGEGNLGSSLGQSVAYALVGVGVWWYHGSILRGDGDAKRQEQVRRLEKTHVALISFGDGQFGQTLAGRLQKELPSLVPDLISMPLEIGSYESIITKIGEASLIVGPWPIAIAGGFGGKVPAQVVQAVVTSAGRKILIPGNYEGWSWAGMDSWNDEMLTGHTVRAIKQFMEGEDIKLVRPMSAGSIIGIIVGVLILLLLIAIPVLGFFMY